MWIMALIGKGFICLDYFIFQEPFLAYFYPIYYLILDYFIFIGTYYCLFQSQHTFLFRRSACCCDTSRLPQPLSWVQKTSKCRGRGFWKLADCTKLFGWSGQAHRKLGLLLCEVIRRYMSWSHNSGFIFFKTNKKWSSLFVFSPSVNLSCTLYFHSRHTFWMNGHLSECNGRPNLVGISWRVPTLSDNHCEPTLLGLYGLQYTFCWSLYSSIWFFCSIFLQKIKVAVLSKMLLCARSASEQFSREIYVQPGHTRGETLCT